MSEPSASYVSRLPEGWSAVERYEDVVDADGLRLHRVGLASKRAGVEAIGSAADLETSPLARAEFELLERASILEAARTTVPFRVRHRDGTSLGTRSTKEVFPSSGETGSWAYAKSNGAALHATWSRACDHAEQELVERDRILRAWIGQTAPSRLEVEGAGLPRTRSYEWSAYAFPAPASGTVASSIEVVGLFGFPCKPDAPLVLGYAGRRTIAQALTAATREAMQLLAFLWGEPIAERAPPMTPTPMYHLEMLQRRDRHVLLRRWLQGAHRAHHRPSSDGTAPVDAVEPSFVNLTPPWLEGLHVAKAISDHTLPLTFGLSPTTSHLPADLRIHPIA